MLKKIIIFAFLIIFIISFPSCSLRNKNTNDKILTIYTDPDFRTINQAIDYFNHSGSVAISKKEGTQLKDDNDFENFRTKFTAEIMSGNGPDIIIALPWVFTSVHKVVASGAFYDLNKLISSDKQFNLSDYNAKVMDSGIFGGKRYLIPIDFNMFIPITSKEILKNNNITFSDIKTLKDFSEEAKKFTALHKERGKWFMYGVNARIIIQQIIKNSDLNFVDYKSKTVKFDTAEFKDFLSICRDIYESIAPVESVKYDPYESINKDAAIMSTDFFDPNWYIRTENNNTQMYLMPSYGGCNYAFMEPMKCIGINVKCKYKNEAFKFIKLLLSEKFQHISRDIPKYELFLPVNKKAYIEDSNFIIYNLDDSNTDKYDQIKAIKDDDKRNRLIKDVVRDQYNQMQKIGASTMHDNGVISIIWEEVQNYFNGKETVSKAAETIENKVLLFLNE